MAVLKLKAVKRSLSSIKKYLEKNERAAYIGSNTYPSLDSWDEDLQLEKDLLDKTEGIQFYHLIQSFEHEEGKENYNAKTVHEMGLKLAEAIEDKGFSCVVVTHDDTDHLHNHIIINSVHRATGKKLRISKARGPYENKYVDIKNKELQKLNDDLCKEYGLHTITESKQIKTEREIKEGKQPIHCKANEYYVKVSYKDITREKLQQIFKDPTIKTSKDFEAALAMHNIIVVRNTAKTGITYLDKDTNKRCRAKSLGAFNNEDVAALIKRNNSRKEQVANTQTHIRSNQSSSRIINKPTKIQVPRDKGETQVDATFTTSINREETEEERKERELLEGKSNKGFSL